MKHIGTKLFAGFISMAIMTIGALWIVQAGFMRDTYMNDRIKAVNQAVTNISSGSVALQDYQDISEELNINLVVISSDGDIEFRSQGLPMMGMMMHNLESMIPAQIDGKVRYINARSGDSRYAVVGRETVNDGYVFAVFSMADLDGAMQLVNKQLWIITIVMLVSSVILAVYLSRLLARPIRAVTGAARQMASGNLDVRLPVISQDEIGQLTIALNDLGSELHRTEELRRELIANVSHELRSPLSVIQGYAETVRDVTWPDEYKRTEQLNLISSEAKRLERVVKDILVYSRLSAGVEKINLTSFPLCPAFDQVKLHFELEAKNRGISFNTACPYVNVRFDRDRFDQVLYNLVNNAINHAQSGTVVDITAFGISGSGPERVCRIEVHNTGITIPSDELQKIWDRYYRSVQDSSTELLGTGLGLAITKSIFDIHKVNYGAESNNGHTVFWFETVALTL